MAVILYAIGYKPDEIEALQPQEINLIIDGIELADERENRRLAYFTTWMVAPHVKKGRVSMDKILKPLLRTKKDKNAKEDKEFLEGLLKNGK